MGKLIMGRLPETRAKVEGYGVKFIGNQTFVITNDGEVEVIPTSLRICADHEKEKFTKEVMTNDQVTTLHELLVQTTIDYLRSQNIKDVDEVSFGVDGLIPSVEYGQWTPATDSSLSIYGYEDNKKKLIGYSI
jgi:hypothetical protein